MTLKPIKGKFYARSTVFNKVLECLFCSSALHTINYFAVGEGLNYENFNHENIISLLLRIFEYETISLFKILIFLYFCKCSY